MEAFQNRMWEDPEYRAKIYFQAMQRGEVIFDEESHSWGVWPDDPAECVGTGYLSGTLFDDDLNETLLEADEDKLAAVEEFVRRGEGSVFDWFYRMLEESKRKGLTLSVSSQPNEGYLGACPLVFEPPSLKASLTSAGISAWR